MLGPLDKYRLDIGVSPVIGVILMILVTVMLAAIIASFVLGPPSGDTYTRIEIEDGVAYLDVDPDGVQSGDEINISYQVINNGDESKVVLFEIVSEIERGQRGPITKRMVVEPNSDQTAFEIVNAKSVDVRTELPIAVDVIVEGGEEYHAHNQRLVIEPAHAEFASKYGLLAVAFMTSILLMLGSIINSIKPEIKGLVEISAIFFAFSTTSVGVIGPLWDYFRVVESNFDIFVMLTVVCLSVATLVYLYQLSVADSETAI